MDCRNLWRYFANKKHEQLVRYRRHQRGALKNPDVSKVRIDIQGSIYPTDRYAYTHCHFLEAAHSLVYKRIQKLGTPNISVLYLDGDQQARSKALVNADKAVQQFADRVDNNLRIRKQHFINVEN
ncbi:hypothetical protein BG015_008430 [Linnemannia schmuckeri]|uniref:Uncharacterized protein n=1 Tax=Linnemannia schmuckeri TaxID=64567 RepID=A0A9P5RWY2_9FUNG|nr:hypothetical protein BG015_008430 [Linnemannia schmuckeri]